MGKNVLHAANRKWHKVLNLSNDVSGNENFFDVSSDNGMAFLREPGAFLAPNHFKFEEQYENFALFCGANIIMTRELIESMFKCTEKFQSETRDYMGQ